MTDQELSRLEAEFHVTLPVVYRRTMIEFPVAELKGNNHTYFWNNARSLSQLNKLVRVDGFIPHGPWPPQMFAIGRADGDNVVSAIDVRDPEAPVWTFQMDVLTAGPPHELEKRFTDFVTKFVDFAPQLLKGRSRAKPKAASGTVAPSWGGRALDVGVRVGRRPSCLAVAPRIGPDDPGIRQSHANSECGNTRA